jgi:predicted AAA+ superfamily ATPase
MIITYDDEGEIVRDGLKIEIRPAWKWVVNGEC